MDHRYQSPSTATPQSDAYHDGLEVASLQHNNLEVHSPYDGPMSVTHDQQPFGTPRLKSEPLYSDTPRPVPAAHPVNDKDNFGNVAKTRRRNIGFIVGAVVAVIIAGIVSGVVGWQVTEARTRDRIAALEAQLGGGGNGGGNGGGACNQEDTRGVEQTIQKGSSLSVTSYRLSAEPSAYEMRVYYQKPYGGSIFYSVYSTSYGAWTRPLEVDRNSENKRDNKPPMAGSPITASVALVDQGARPVPFDQLLFVTHDGQIAMQDWGPAYPLRGTRASTYTSLGKKVNTGGQVAYLWPHSVFEESSGRDSVKLTHLIQPYSSSSNFSSIDVQPAAGVSPGTAIVALPLKSQFKAPELRLAYRTRDGQLGIFDRSAANSTREVVLSQARVLDKGSMTGFSYRPNDSLLVTTKLLFRGADNKIQIMTQSSGMGDLTDTDRWDGPKTDAVFDNIDADSHVSCLTNAIAWYGSVKREVIEHDGMNMCFFQEKGKLKQVQFVGTAWKVVGFVPMPAE